MRSFRSYIEEIETLEEASGATLFARLKAAKASLPRARRHIATKQDAAKAKTLPKPSAPSFPWWMAGKHTGWWSPSKAFLFTWKFGMNDGNYHVTQIVKNPSMFGTTEEEIKNVLEKWAEKMPEFRKPDEVLDHLKSGRRDKMGELERFVFAKGWVRIVVGNAEGLGSYGVDLEGEREYCRKAVAAAISACPWKEGNEYFFTVYESNVAGYGKTLSGLSEAEAYVQGKR